MIKEIRVTLESEAAPGSQSSLHGTGRFPLHTATVFWPIPVRYVVLRVIGDTRRPTTVLPFAQLLRESGGRVATLAERSVWLAGAKSRPFYCSMKFTHNGVSGWRYDADNMSPANDAANEVDQVLRRLVASGIGDHIQWSGETAVVLANWHVLHGRGPEPMNEGVRIVERLYVR